MPTTQTKGITVKIDAELHAEIKAYLEQNEMTMSEFIALAAQDELHPKIQQEVHTMPENTRTLAFQVPESLFQRIKDYLARNHMTQKAFVIGLIEEELDRDEGLQQQEQGQGDAEEEQDDSPVEAPAPDFAPEDSPLQEEEQAVADFEDGYDGPTEEPDDGPVEEESPDFALEDSPQQEEEQTTGGFEDGYDSQVGEPDTYFSAEDGQEEYDPSQNEEEMEEEYMGMSM